MVFVGLPRMMGVDVEIGQGQPILARGIVADFAPVDMPMNMARAVDVLDDITSWLELPTVRIGQAPFAVFVAAEKPPIFLGDGVDDGAVPVLSPRIEDVDEGLESLERIECQLGNRIFRFSFRADLLVGILYILCNHDTII